MLAQPLIGHLSETQLFDIAQFLSYRDVLRLLSTCKPFQQYRQTKELSEILLQKHLHIDHRKTALTYEQAYRRVMQILVALEYKYGVTNPKETIRPHIKTNIFSLIKQTKALYSNASNLDDDLEFLVIKAVANALQNKKLLLLGGACFYYTTSIFHLGKWEEMSVNIRGLELYPFVKLAGDVVFADLKNCIGLGPKQRYFVFDSSGPIVKMINIREQFVLKRGEPYRNENGSFMYCDFYGTSANDLQSDCTTRGIRVRAVARPAYDDQRCTWDNIVYTYQIRMSDAGTSPKGCRLQSREWLIEEFDQHGNRTVEEVKGEGVIGKYPLIRQGCLDFKYQSCSMVSKKYGRMSGAFVFEDLSTKEQFRVEVRPFRLDLGADRRVEYNSETKTTRIIE